MTVTFTCMFTMGMDMTKEVGFCILIWLLVAQAQLKVNTLNRTRVPGLGANLCVWNTY